MGIRKAGVKLRGMPWSRGLCPGRQSATGALPDARSRRALMAPRAWPIGAGEGNRTLVFSLEGCCSTIELHPRTAVQLSRHSGGLNCCCARQQS